MDMINKAKMLLPLLLLGALVLAFSACSKEEEKSTDDTTTAVPTKTTGTATFADDVLPLFTTKGAFFENSQKCVDCHFNNTESSQHLLDMSSHEGILLGADLDPATGQGVDILGRHDDCTDPDYTATAKECDTDWGHSKLKGRLRNTRMPPGWEAALQTGGYLEDAAGRDTAEIEAIGAWVTAGAQETQGTTGVISYDTLLTDIVTDAAGAIVVSTGAAGEVAMSWTKTDHAADAKLGDLFIVPSAFYKGGQNCSGCHFDNSEKSQHLLKMDTYIGIMRGADVDPDSGLGVDILGRADGCTNGTASGADCATDWGHSKLKERLRNTRMPPGWEAALQSGGYDETAANRDSAQINLIESWVEAGAPNGEFTVIDWTAPAE